MHRGFDQEGGMTSPTSNAALLKKFHIKSLSVVRHIGARPYQEDQFVLSYLCDERFLLASVMDGHDGGNCSRFLKKRLPLIMSQYLIKENFHVTEALLTRILLRLHWEWEQYTLNHIAGGSTLTGIIIDANNPDMIWTFNLGDSRTMIYNSSLDNWTYSTIDHDLSTPRQMQIRSMRPNAIIQKDEHGILRICGDQVSLNLSGAYGNTKDVRLRQSLLRQPEIDCVRLSALKRWTTIIASDGLWDDLSTLQIKAISNKKGTDTPLAVRLQNQVKRLGQKQDNLCIICLEHE